MSKIVVTGGAGFIGSHVAEHLAETYKDAEIVILDKMTYAAHYDNIKHFLHGDQVRLVVGDICDLDLCNRVLEGADLLIHLAAESHVDNSFRNSITFTMSNTLGTHNLLEASRTHEVPKIIHISTDEVYGEVLAEGVDESACLNPTNPYSASKAGAEMLVMSYLKSFKMPIIRTRANNIFGIRQFPEKLIPRCCLSLIRGEKIPLHGNGMHVRHYLDARDFAESVVLLIEKGVDGEVYNIGSNDELTNCQVAETICKHFGVSAKENIEFVGDRPFNDQRYAVSTKKIEQIGWKIKRNLLEELPRVVAWYKENAGRYVNFKGVKR
jgi:UDP-glucose 4,6-dehydratase